MMTTTMMRRRALGVGAVLIGTGTVLLGPALAQAPRTGATAPTKPGTNAPTAPAVPAEPGATTASFGDWVMRCQRGGPAEKPVRVCEAAQSIQVQGQAQPIAQIAIGRAGAGEPLQVTVVLPPNVTFPSSVRVQADEKETGSELPWRRCLPGACVADAPAKDDLLKRWRGASEAGRITFKSAGGQDVVIPLSWRGLPQALDALAKEPG